MMGMYCDNYLCVLFANYYSYFCYLLASLALSCRYLSEDELLVVIDKIHPSERYYAKQQADYVISQVSG